MKKKMSKKRRDQFLRVLEQYEKQVRNALDRDADDITELQSEWQERDSPAERSLRYVEWNQFSSLNNELSEIEDSRKRIENNTYGYCEDCEEPIPDKRLTALPTATKCIECQSNAEKELGAAGKQSTL